MLNSIKFFFHWGSIESTLYFNVLLTYGVIISYQVRLELAWLWAQSGLQGTGSASTTMFTLMQARIQAVSHAFLSVFYGTALRLIM